MIDRIFAPALTFVMLIAGSAAILSGLFVQGRTGVVVAVAQSAQPAPIVLETVVITAKRAAAASAAGKANGNGHGVQLRRAND